MTTPTEVLVICASHSPGMDRDTEQLFGQEFRAGMARARAAVDAFAPQLVVLFGGDHRRVFRHIVPAFSVVRSATTLAESQQLPGGPIHVPTALADQLTHHLMGSGFDVAVCRDVELDHAFSQPMRDLLGDSRVPVLPLPINCASPPLPSPERVIAFGRAVRAGLEGAGRVLAIGTGGLSHSPPSLETDRHDLTEDERREIVRTGLEAARDRIRPDWDQAFLTALADWDEERLARIVWTAAGDAGVGANEVRTWLAAAAMGGQGLRALAYEPVREWITGMGVAVSGNAVTTDLLDATPSTGGNA